MNPLMLMPFLSRIKKFIHGDDYVRCKHDLKNEVKEYQSSKKSKPIDRNPRVSVQDRLGP